jgi:hypothetical protein
MQFSSGRNTNIIVGQKDMFDYSQGEPAADFVTFLRVLEVCFAAISRFVL